MKFYAMLLLLGIGMTPVSAQNRPVLARVVTVQYMSDDLRALRKCDGSVRYCYSCRVDCDDLWGRIAVEVVPLDRTAKYALSVCNADEPPSPEVFSEFRCPASAGANDYYTSATVLSALEQTIAGQRERCPECELEGIHFPVCFVADTWDNIRERLREKMLTMTGATGKSHALKDAFFEALATQSLRSEIDTMLRRCGYRIDGRFELAWDFILIQQKCIGLSWKELAVLEDLGLGPVVISVSVKRVSEKE